MRWIATAVVGLAACHHAAYSVSATPNGGIPFFQFESVDVLTKTFEQKWYEVTVSADVVPQNTKPEDYAKAKYTQSLTVFTMKPDRAAAVLRALGDYTEAQPAYFALRAMMQGSDFTLSPPEAIEVISIETAADAKLVAVARSRTQVPGSKTWYVNSEIPFGGTGSNAFQLGSNGTLSQASSSVTDQLPGSVLTALGGLGSAAITGYTGLLGARATAAATVTAAANTASQAWLNMRPPEHNGEGPHYIAVKANSLQVKRTYRLVLERSSALADNECDLAAAKRFATGASAMVGGRICRGSYSVDVSKAAPSDPDSRNTDAAAIQIKGTVVMPSPTNGK